MKLKKKKKIKGKEHGLAYMTREEMEAMNVLKNSPGFLGRMARVGEQMPMSKRDGYPSFDSDVKTDQEKDADDFYGEQQSNERSEQAYEEAKRATLEGDSYQSDDPFYQHAFGGGDNSGGSGGGGNASRMTREQAMEQFGLMENQDLDALKKTAADEALQAQRDSARQKRVDEYEGYKGELDQMREDYDLSGERDAVRGYADKAEKFSADYDTRMQGLTGEYEKMGGYESDVAGMRGDVAGIRGDVRGLTGDVKGISGDVRGLTGDVKGIRGKVGDLGAEALDREALMKDRGFYSGLAESARKSQQRGAEEKLMRGMAGAGSSPEQIAMAKAKLQSGGEAARRDALTSAQAAMTARQSQLGQASNLYGQQAGLVGQQAGLYGQQAGLVNQQAGLYGQQAGLVGQQAGLTGQAQGLGMNRLGALGQNYGNMANMGLTALGQMANFQGQSAGLLTQEMTGQGQMLQGQVGMTDAQLGDIRERENMAFQERMADKNAQVQIEAANASKSGGGGGGGVCCWIMLEARYGDGTMDDVVRRYRDEVLCPRKRRGYYRMAKVLVPLMRKSKVFKQVVAWTFADPLVAWGEWYYGKNKWGWIMSPIKNFWMGTLYVVGGETEFLRENGEVV